ncbi:hypothetical protein Ahy_B04g072161 [Arachis hypogaea]|uniref:Uncharacterized protein n=1 Tax=Arachis hypogaea TaxID=3818 RepID=A0A444ZMK3_ARAHY|nr:hypothetical protein Ahy_B04g072161 [Arachis hypogaea]
MDGKDIDEGASNFEDCWYQKNRETDIRKMKGLIRKTNHLNHVMLFLYQRRSLINSATLIVKVLSKRVASAIGSILKIDCATSIYSRGGFARICMEIDLSKKLISRILVFGSTFNIEYEYLHLICFNYGKYDHRVELSTKI